MYLVPQSLRSMKTCQTLELLFQQCSLPSASMEDLSSLFSKLKRHQEITCSRLTKTTTITESNQKHCTMTHSARLPSKTATCETWLMKTRRERVESTDCSGKRNRLRTILEHWAMDSTSRQTRTLSQSSVTRDRVLIWAITLIKHLGLLYEWRRRLLDQGLFRRDQSRLHPKTRINNKNPKYLESWSQQCLQWSRHLIITGQLLNSLKCPILSESWKQTRILQQTRSRISFETRLYLLPTEEWKLQNLSLALIKRAMNDNIKKVTKDQESSHMSSQQRKKPMWQEPHLLSQNCSNSNSRSSRHSRDRSSSNSCHPLKN